MKRQSGISRELVCPASASKWLGYTTGIKWTIALPSCEVNAMAARANTAAQTTTKLLIGPTTEVRMTSRTGLLKFRGSTGVGLAHPSTGSRSEERREGKQRRDDK